MRYYEIFESDYTSLGLYDPSADQSAPEIADTRKPKITLKLLNRLKKIKNRRRSEKLKKLAFYPAIYGDHDMADDYEMQQRELEQIKDEISLEKDAIELAIDKSEIDEKSKAHLRTLANRALKQQGI